MGFPYIVYRPNNDSGFLSNFLWLLDGISRADKLDLRPVVDMQNYRTVYHHDLPVETNLWDELFIQPSDLTLADALQIQHYDGQGLRTGEFTDLSARRFKNSRRTRAGRLLVKRLIRPRDDLLAEVDSSFSNIPRERCLGVHVRGTDMRATPGHPVPADFEYYLKQAERIFYSQGFEHLFLATDEARVEKRARQIFGNALLTNDVERSEGGLSLHAGIGVGARLAREVLLDVLSLSRTGHLIGGRSNVTVAASLFAQDNQEIFEISPERENLVRVLKSNLIGAHDSWLGQTKRTVTRMTGNPHKAIILRGPSLAGPDGRPPFGPS